MTKRHADNSGNHADLQPLKISATTRSNGSNLKFLLITQHEGSLINTSEGAKRLSYLTENGKCTNVTKLRSRLRAVNPILQQYMFVDWALQTRHHSHGRLSEQNGKVLFGDRSYNTSTRSGNLKANK